MMSSEHHPAEKIEQAGRTISGFFWALLVPALALMVFFALTGAFNPAESILGSVIVISIAVLWIAHAVWRRRRPERDHNDKHMQQDRERRGY